MTLTLVPLERSAGDAIELLKGMMGVRCCVVGVAIIRTSTLRPGSATVLSTGVVRSIVTIVQKRDWNIPANKLYPMVCPHVRGDNPRALYVNKPFYTTYISVDLAHEELLRMDYLPYICTNHGMTILYHLHK